MLLPTNRVGDIGPRKKMLKTLVVVALVAACSASQLNQPRPAIAARSQESLALRLRGVEPSVEMKAS